MTFEDELDTEALGSTELSATPHLLISGQIERATDAAREKVAAELVAELGLDLFDARTLALASASTTQLRHAMKQRRVRRVGKHQFTFIEVDIVTWRIVPSPENVRFEDQRSGVANVYRYTGIPEAPATLHLEVAQTTELIDQLERQSSDILRDNPHAPTIAVRGIEVAGVLSLARAHLADRDLTVGYLDATDGFSRSVGAHRGLGVSPRDVILKFSDSEFESAYRRDLLKLRDSDPDGANLVEEELRKLRSSVMPRAQVIVGYENLDSKTSGSQTFDRARRTLVGHIHMAPPMAFSPAAQWAAKANAIREGLLGANELPTTAGLDSDTSFNLLSGNEGVLDDAGVLMDEYAVIVLQAMRPMLTTKRGRVVQMSVQDLTGQKVSLADLAMIAAEVALRPEIQRRNLTSVHADKTLESLRSVLGRAWDSSIFAGVQFSGRSISELLAAAIEEHRFEVSTTEKDSRPPKSARGELAALASFDMVTHDKGSLLVRAIGRKNSGVNMSEPNQVIAWMYRSEDGLNQLAQLVRDVRAGRTPQVLAKGQPSIDTTIGGAIIATAESIRDAFRPEKQKDSEPEGPNSLPATPQEQMNRALLYLTEAVDNLVDSVRSVAQITGSVGAKSDVSIVEEEGAVVSQELMALLQVNLQLHSWQSTAEAHARARSEYAAGEGDDDSLD